MSSILARRPQNRSFSSIWIALRDEELGATMVDYAVLLAIVSIGLVAAIGALSTQISAVIEACASGMSTIQQ